MQNVKDVIVLKYGTVLPEIARNFLLAEITLLYLEKSRKKIIVWYLGGYVLVSCN
jgi:hypothetical protein